MRNLSATTLALLALTGTLTVGALLAQNKDAPALPVAAGLAPAGPVQIALPFNKAVVRESVPIKLREFTKNGYVSVSIDGHFVTAQPVPNNPRQPVYVWDSKAPYNLTDAAGSPQFYADGAHAITITLFDAQSKPVGTDTVAVQLANKIALPPGQGITLSYPWKISTNLRYQRRTELNAVPADAADSTVPLLIQQSLLRFRRTVENATEGQYLLRDVIVPVDRSSRPKPFVSYVVTRGNPAALSSFSALYRVVDSRGRVLSELPYQNKPSALGFSIPVLPPRRVSLGARWESPISLTLDWASPTPAKVTATSVLEDFEWQDRYPTAKIRQTYTGPATFLPTAGSALPPIIAQDVKFERVIYFAYNAGRIVRMQTRLTLTTNSPGLLTAGGGVGGYPGGGYPGGGYPGSFGIRGGGGYPGGGFPGGGYPGSFGIRGGGYPGGYPGGGFEGGYPGGYPGGFSGYPGGYPGGFSGYPGGFSGYPSGYPGGLIGGPNPESPTKLTYTETSVTI